MSRTYIGPFGRILPVLDHSSDGESSGTEGQRPSSQESQSNMATTYQLPPPQIPVGLEFGSDPRPGFSEPRNYDISSQSRRTLEQHQRQTFDEPRRSYNIPHGQLPPVSQLLTPASQSTGTSSPPYSSHQSPAGPETKPEQLSPRHPEFRGTPSQTAALPYQSAYGALPCQPTSQDSLLARTPRYVGPPAVQPYATPMQPVHDSNMNPYPHASASQPRLYPSYLQQPSNPALTAAHARDPLNQPGLYDYPRSSAPRSDQSTGSNVTQNVKPLPRVVGDQDVPGEGPCWIYEDGSICKKIIDGELVNAQWGVTKAGKPRKRLAIACTTCREKKIKCDPAEGKCLQCEKFGRECRFTTA